MRVALVGDEYYPDIGGAPIYAFELSRHLVKLGIEAEVITHAHRHQHEEEKIFGVKVRHIGGSVLKSPHRAVSPLAFRRCHRYIHDGAFDIVHGLDMYSSMAQMAVRYAHRIRIPCVLTCHSVLDSPLLVPMQRLMLLGLKKTDRLIAVSRASVHFSRRLGFREDSIAVVPNGVDLSCFHHGVDGSLMRRELNIRREPLVAAASRLIKRRNLALLISAFPTVLQAIPEAKLVIAGAGREQKRLSDQARQLNIADSVLMTGQLAREKVAQLMAAADVFVSPSSTESFGLSLLEAAAVGTPVVCPPVGGIPEFYRDGFNALLYPPGDAVAMAHAMIRLIQDKQLSETIRANAAETASRLTWEIAAERTFGVYEEVLQESRCVGNRRDHR